MLVEKHCGTTDQNHEAEFQGPIARMIPLLIKLLESRDKDARQKTLELIEKLANHGEWKAESIAGRLTRMTKSSMMEPSQARFHRSLNYLKAGTWTFGGRVLRSSTNS